MILQLYIFILLLCNGLCYNFEPSCSTCKFFVPSNIKFELGLCNMFYETIIYDNNSKKQINYLAIYCRSNENFCGKLGLLYQPYNKNNKEKNQLNKLENDFVEIFEQMKKHNTKTTYKNSREIYKLLKNKNTKN